MNGHATPQAGRVRRRLREFWPGRNPLGRRCDRTEAMILGVLLATFVIGGTLAALIAGRLAYDGALRARHAELNFRAERHAFSRRRSLASEDVEKRR